MTAGASDGLQKPWFDEPEVRRLPAAIALIAIGVAYLFLPQRLRVGPAWLVLAVELLLLAALLIAHRIGYHDIAYRMGRIGTGIVTLAVGISAVFLITRLPGGKLSGNALLQQAGLVWLANIAVFALWYWELDGGGPAVRTRTHYRSVDFVFPQFQQDPGGPAEPWMPDFFDYLFLAFNTSTAFSPTDTLVLSRRAKLLLMTQSLISLIVIAVLAARAINTL
jgi:hypothetical protein